MEDLKTTNSMIDEDLRFAKFNEIDSIAEELLEVLIKHQVTFAEAWRIQNRLRDKVQYLIDEQKLKKEPVDI